MTKMHPIFEQAMAPFIKPCAECEQYDRVHDQNCPEHPDYDPTPWCSACGSRTKSGCHCGPIAENE